MPVASSSRRRVIRQPSSDIEEDNPTQRGKFDEVDEDEEVQPRRSTKRVKKEKQTANLKKKQERKDKEKEVDPDDEDDDDRIDIDNFTNQPLGKAEEAKLKGMAADWVNMRKLIGSSAFPMLKDVGMSMAEAAQGDDEEKGFAELDTIIKDLIDIDEEMAAHQSTIDDIRQKLLQGEDIDNVLERYDAGGRDKVKEYNTKTTRQKYAKNEHYTVFRQEIYEVQHSGQAMPPITDLIPKEDGDDSDDDEDVEMGAVTQDYKCPLTLTILADPMTSQVCGHSFSATAIRDYLKGSARKECPSAGCNKSFAMSDVKPNKDLAKRVKLANRRAQRQEEDSDAEEVIE